jgi:hypothetical protein
MRARQSPVQARLLVPARGTENCNKVAAAVLLSVVRWPWGLTDDGAPRSSSLPPTRRYHSDRIKRGDRREGAGESCSTTWVKKNPLRICLKCCVLCTHALCCTASWSMKRPHAKQLIAGGPVSPPPASSAASEPASAEAALFFFELCFGVGAPPPPGRPSLSPPPDQAVLSTQHTLASSVMQFLKDCANITKMAGFVTAADRTSLPRSRRRIRAPTGNCHTKEL